MEERCDMTIPFFSRDFVRDANRFLFSLSVIDEYAIAIIYFSKLCIDDYYFLPGLTPLFFDL